MKLLRRSLLPAVILAAALAVPAAAGAAVTDQTVALDTHSTGLAGSAGAVSTDDLLAVGKLYVVEASGTWSKWKSDAWSVGTCGTPEPQPVFPSPGVTNGLVGLDAETLFGARGTGGSCPGMPTHQGGLLMRFTESDFRHYEPFGGKKTTPSADHTYTYGVVGNGLAASFKIGDRPVGDNYGVLKLRVRLANPDDCADGFPSFNFPSEADCRAFFSNGGNVVDQGDNFKPGNLGGNFLISHNGLTVTAGGALIVRVSCRSPVPCRGDMSLDTAAPSNAAAAKRVRVGKKLQFDIPPKTRKVLFRFNLSKATRKLIKAKGTVSVRALAHVRLGNPPFKFNGHSRFPVHRRHR
jgi:hypothetical protein